MTMQLALPLTIDAEEVQRLDAQRRALQRQIARLKPWARKRTVLVAHLGALTRRQLQLEVKMREAA